MTRTQFRRRFGAACALAAILPLSAQEPRSPGEAIDFDRQIRPIFESRCIECHGAKKQNSGLRLDRKSSVFIGGDSGQPALVPGRSGDSPIFQRISTEDRSEIMPPKGAPLTPAQVQVIKAWIDQGGAWPDEPEEKHWAYEKPIRPELPPVNPGAWPKNPIDYFVLHRLGKEGLQPSPEADRATLIRRVSLDLTGLPPSVEEVDQFLSDQSPDAYEKVVDRLLASPHYGERWAKPWLDLARYADTQGYEKDNRRTIWPYRDWVIQALNQDMPFSQFTIEQIAGDMLPDATLQQRVATGFHRNTMTNTEGGTDDEEFRHEAVVDRVNTTMAVWMGTTMSCAQCHNHKYDPITMKEYYQFYAFLNSTADNDQPDERPVMKVPTPDQESELKRLQAEIAALEKEYHKDLPGLEEAQLAWETESIAALNAWQVVDPRELTSAGGATLTKKDDSSILAGGTNPPNDTYTITFTAPDKKITGIRLQVLPDGSLPYKSIGRHPNGSFVLSRFEISIARPETEPQPLVILSATADYTQDGHSVMNLVDGKPGPGWAISAADPKHRVERSAYFTLETPVELEPDSTLAVVLRHASQWPEANLGRFRLSVTAAKNPGAIPTLPEPVRAALLASAENRPDKQKETLRNHFRSIAPELLSVREELARARKAESDLDKQIPRTMVMEELSKPRETHMLIRGGFMSRGDKVSPGIPAVFHPLPQDKPANRLTLAEWLVDENNPLTARVTMNRFWEEYFGTGMVETSEDFGAQGELPTHPELLDWLATEFMSQGWSMKAMHRIMVTSATYRQSSRPTPDLLERDPYNRLFARGPRVRLPAELLRDQALAVSGLLSRKLGGPSVMPPQPEGLWQVVYSGDRWETSKGEDKYRRGLYTFWRRTMPHPAMTTFDAPSREFCVIKRTRSNTPLQALVLLNDPAFVEAAQALARRIVHEKSGAIEARAEYAFRLCLARQPRPEELRRVVHLFQQELELFKTDRDAALRMASSQLGAPPPEMDIYELAAWSVVANVLLNLDELITKG
jgi:mono/diheme cytochrome c family protein